MGKKVGIICAGDREAAPLIVFRRLYGKGI